MNSATPSSPDIASTSFPSVSFKNTLFSAFSLLVAILKCAPTNAFFVVLSYLYIPTPPVCISGVSESNLLLFPYTNVAWFGID